jgi:hypothetical protein
MLRMVLRKVALLAVFGAAYSTSGRSQTVSFGVVTGAQLTEDFRTLHCPDLKGTEQPAPAGCPRLVGGAFGVTDASRRFIIGPKVTVHFSPLWSLEVDALHREIRTHNTRSFQICPPDQTPDCTTLASYTYAATETEFTWEFSLLGKYRIPVSKVSPFVVGGPSFRPAENREQYGFTFGGGVEWKTTHLRLTPALRYSRWRDDGKYIGLNQHQLQFVLGIDGQPSTERISAFGHKLSLGVEAGLALTDGLRRHNEIATNILEVDPITGVLTPVDKTSVLNSNRTNPVIGGVIEYGVSKNLSVEFSGLYRPLNASDVSTYSNGITRERRFTVLTWEFPLVGKYKLPVLNSKPFLELGPSFRAAGNLNGATPSHLGIAAGAGIELPQRGVRIVPTLRFTRWAADHNRSGMETNSNQVELVFGLRF